MYIENTANVSSSQEPKTYNPSGDVTIVAVDCGIKYNQIRCLCQRGATVKVVPYNYQIKSGGMYFIVGLLCTV